MEREQGLLEAADRIIFDRGGFIGILGDPLHRSRLCRSPDGKLAAPGMRNVNRQNCPRRKRSSSPPDAKENAQAEASVQSVERMLGIA
jgi:hypothetical protein